jgi:hypothetical protein
MARKIKTYIYCIYFVLSGSILMAQIEKCGTFRQIERYGKNKTLKIGQIPVPRPEMQKSILTLSNG